MRGSTEGSFRFLGIVPFGKLPSWEANKSVEAIGEKGDSDCELDAECKTEIGDGVLCLDRTYEESYAALLISSSITVGISDETEDNPYKATAVLRNDPDTGRKSY